MLFTPLWFWGLCREALALAQSSVVRGGRLDDVCLRLNLARGESGLDLVFWLTPPYARVECLKPGRPGDLPGQWAALSAATLVSVGQPHADRRLLFEFALEDRRLELEFFAYGRPALVLRDAAATEKPIVQIGTAPRGAKDSGVPFILDLQQFPLPGEDPSDVKLAEWLQRAVRGTDQFWAEAALNAAALEADAAASAENIASTAKLMRAWAEELSSAAPAAFVVYEGDEPVGVAQIDLGQWLPRYRFERAETLSLASSRLVYRHRKRESAGDDRRELLLKAAAHRKRLVRRREALAVERTSQLDYRMWQENADWLNAHLSTIAQGTEQLEVETADGPRTVTLDPALRPARQAERWYQKARRLKRGVAVTEKRLAETDAEIAGLEAAIAAVESAATSDDESIAPLFARLQALLGGKTIRRTGPRQEVRPPFRRFKSPGGLAIWVGRDNRENDELTLHHAHKNDLWFHAQQTPGSHVVLRSHATKQGPAKSDILAAAATAAFYSKARNSKKVPVIYTEARYVRKPRNAPPGQVRVEREKSLMVEPERMPPWDDE